ncbi:MAG: DUF3987 domain-containing protein [Bacteroidaceae bacterium]|nr:DUF3987 domain-containing protein [Bacteroidaceae bacterium]
MKNFSYDPVHFNGNQKLELQNGNESFTCYGSHPGLAVKTNKVSWEEKRKSEELRNAVRLIRNAEPDSPEQKKLKRRLSFWTPHCSLFKDNKRQMENAQQPLMRVMEDYDQDKGRSREIMEKALALEKEGKWKILLVEENPRGGTHVLHNIPKGMTAWEASREFSDAIGEVPDLSVVSLEHFIYMVSDQQTLYVSDELFEGYDPASGAHEAWDSSKRFSNKKSTTECPTRKLLMPNQITNTYTPSEKDKRIVQMAEKALGGMPREGMRNNFLLNMTILLSYHYGRNPALLKTIIPHYGQNEMEFNSTIESGCRPEYHNVYYMQLMNNIAESLQGVCANTVFPEMPGADKLPPSINAIIYGTPEEAQTALAIGAFSAMATHLYNVKFMYVNNRATEPAFMNLLVADFGSGKSAIDYPLDCILESVTIRDDSNRAIIDKWKQECSSRGTTKDKPKRPTGCPIQIIQPNTTTAAFVQLLAEADGHPLYTKMQELDMMKRLNGNGKENFDIIRIAYDHAFLGQERVGVESVSTKAPLRWNWNASTTPQVAKSFFKNELKTGTLSRLTVSTIIKENDDWGAEIMVYDNYTPEYKESLKVFIERVKQASGTYNLEEARTWAINIQRRLANLAQQFNDRAYCSLVGRAVLSGFWRAMMLYIMEGQKWTKEIEAFATWSVEYDLWCKMYYFGTQLRKEINYEPTIPITQKNDLFSLLPDTFTKTDAHEFYEQMGKDKKKADTMLRQWVFRKKIVYDQENGLYQKVC